MMTRAAVAPLCFASVVLFTGCSKDEGRYFATVDIDARMCAVEVTRDGATTLDTIIGRFAYTFDHGFVLNDSTVVDTMLVDTLPGTARYNVAFPEGETLTVRVLHLRTPAVDGPVTITVSGDVSEAVTSDAAEVAVSCQ